MHLQLCIHCRVFMCSLRCASHVYVFVPISWLFWVIVQKLLASPPPEHWRSAFASCATSLAAVRRPYERMASRCALAATAPHPRPPALIIRLSTVSQLPNISRGSAGAHVQHRLGRTVAAAAAAAGAAAAGPPHITLIATDVDGTLLDSRQQLSAGNEAAIKQAAAAGVPVSRVVPHVVLLRPRVVLQQHMCSPDTCQQHIEAAWGTSEAVSTRWWSSRYFKDVGDAWTACNSVSYHQPDPDATWESCFHSR
jgi:hypothetical protein